MDVPVEEIELSEEAKAKSAASVELLVEHLERGDGEESPALQSSTETLMNSSFVSPAEEALHLPAHLLENLVDETVVQTLSEPRVRYDFSVSVTRIHLDVEKTFLTSNTNILKRILRKRSFFTSKVSCSKLGGDFTFVGRQKRLRVGDQWFRVDLLFSTGAFDAWWPST